MATGLCLSLTHFSAFLAAMALGVVIVQLERMAPSGADVSTFQLLSTSLFAASQLHEIEIIWLSDYVLSSMGLTDKGELFSNEALGLKVVEDPIPEFRIYL